MYRKGTKGEAHPHVITAADGTQLELYEPSTKALGTVLLIYGMNMLGEKDPRLVSMAQSCVATGLRVAVPVLKGLKSLTLDASDLSAVRESIRFLYNKFNEPVRIVAFSTGGSMALRLTTEHELAPFVSIITLISPVYDPRETWTRIDRLARMPIQNLENADNQIWLSYVTAYRNVRRLGFTDDEKNLIADHLRRYSVGLTKEEKIAFFQSIIQKRPPGNEELLMEYDAFEVISPLGKLAGTNTRVLIIHDANDWLVPPAQSKQLANELGQRVSLNHRLLITPVLSHVNIEHLYYVFDILQIIDFLGELYS